MEPFTVLMNAHAGSGRRSPERTLAGILVNHGVRAVIEPVEPADLAERVGELAGCPVLGIAGGDGTQRTAARVLSGSGTTLVPFPTGTLNHFARRLGLDTVDRAARALTHGGVRAVPVGRVNGHVFVNTAVAGAYPDMVATREQLRAIMTKWPAAAVAAVHELVRWAPVALTVRSSAGVLDCRTAMFWVGIGSGSFPEPHRAPLAGASGDLEIVTLPGDGRTAALRLIVALLRYRLAGGDLHAGALDVRHVSQVEVEAVRPIHLALDGESHRLEPPLRFRFEPDALRVVEPTRR